MNLEKPDTKIISGREKTPVFLGVLDKKASSARRTMTEKQEFTFFYSKLKNNFALPDILHLN